MTALMRLLMSEPGFSGSTAKPWPSGGIDPAGMPNIWYDTYLVRIWEQCIAAVLTSSLAV